MELIKLYDKLVKFVLDNIDKYFHLTVVIMLNLLVITIVYLLSRDICSSLVISNTSCVILSIGKEILDKYKLNPTGFDKFDLVADAIGLIISDIPFITIWIL